MAGAVIYIRVSTKEQTENPSNPTQLRACEDYCRREGLDVLARFKEEGESAKTADRTELQKLPEVEELDVEVILVFAVASCRARPTCGSRPRSASDSGSNDCSFPTNRVRRKSLCSNRRNCTGLQLLAGNRD